MNRKIIFYESYFLEFYQAQDQKVKGKIQYIFELIKQVDRVPEKFLKHLTGTDGLYEIEHDSSVTHWDDYLPCEIPPDGYRDGH